VDLKLVVGRLKKRAFKPDVHVGGKSSTVHSAIAGHNPRSSLSFYQRTIGSAFTRIDVEGLPDSIKTACTIVNQLGVRYFWIDALVSDLPTVRVDLLEDALSPKRVYHPRAWRRFAREAQRMASVYKNALVTITTVDKVLLPDILKQPIVSESNEPKLLNHIVCKIRCI
jgi:hypothetical protein